MDGTVSLRAESVTFYSALDEEAFFGWLRELTCVSHIWGELNVIHIEISTSLVTDVCLRELLALFRRFDLDLRQFMMFDCEEHHDWFRDPRAYWHSAVFG